MMVRSDHNGQGPAGPMAITLGYQPKSMARHPVHMRVTSELLELRDHGVVKDARAVELQPPTGILVDQFEPPVGSALANEDVSDVGHITAGVGSAAAHFHSCDDASCP